MLQSFSAILVKFKKSVYIGEESDTSAPVTVAVSGTVSNATDFFILPMTYENYNELAVLSHTDLPTTSELFGGVDLPHGASGKCLELFFMLCK